MLLILIPATFLFFLKDCIRFGDSRVKNTSFLKAVIEKTNYVLKIATVKLGESINFIDFSNYSVQHFNLQSLFRY